jgi:predicted methyltransferase
MVISRYIVNKDYEDYFKCPVIKEKINNINNNIIISINPFSGKNKMTKFLNDLNFNIDTDCHIDALDFLKLFADNSIDLILYDPPSNPNRMKYYFDKLNLKITKFHTRTQYWSKLKKEIKRIVKKDGYVISIGYNSGGIGKTFDFNIEEVILLNHKNFSKDIFCVIDRKII